MHSSFAFKQYKGVHLHIRSNDKLFNLTCLRAKTKVYTVLIREMLFADDAALTTHAKHDLQMLISQFNHARKEFGLTINITPPPKSTSWVQMSMHLHQSTSMMWCLQSEITSHICALPSTTIYRMTWKLTNTSPKRQQWWENWARERVWENSELTLHTKLKVFQAYVS